MSPVGNHDRFRLRCYRLKLLGLGRRNLAEGILDSFGWSDDDWTVGSVIDLTPAVCMVPVAAVLARMPFVLVRLAGLNRAL
jgi:hypothetical protein